MFCHRVPGSTKRYSIDRDLEREGVTGARRSDCYGNESDKTIITAGYESHHKLDLRILQAEHPDSPISAIVFAKSFVESCLRIR